MTGLWSTAALTLLVAACAARTRGLVADTPGLFQTFLPPCQVTNGVSMVGPTAEGQFVDTLGSELPDSPVAIVDGQDCSVPVQADGHFTVRVSAPGAYHLLLAQGLNGAMSSTYSVKVTAAGTMIPSRLHLPPCGGSPGDLSLHGTVRDDRTRQPVRHAIVLLGGTNCHALTDDSGRYKLVGVAHQQYRLRAQALGYHPTEVFVNLEIGADGRSHDLTLVRSESFWAY